MPPAGQQRQQAAQGRQDWRWLPPAVYVGSLLPAAVLAYDAFAGLLGADPIKRATHQTGQLAIILLLLSLACTPLRLVTGWLGRTWTWPARIRKALGLMAFFYAALHFGIYLFDQNILLLNVGEDIAKRPFITVGFAALLLLVPLAWTSNPQSVRKLGFARWTALHRLVYVAAALAALHYWWGVKQDRTAPALLAAALVVLLLLRLKPSKKKQAVKPVSF